MSFERKEKRYDCQDYNDDNGHGYNKRKDNKDVVGSSKMKRTDQDENQDDERRRDSTTLQHSSNSSSSSASSSSLNLKRKSLEPVANKVPEKKTTVSIQLNSSKIKATKEPTVTKKPSVASVFNNESDSDEEEMPLECRMKMRNIGRDTVTSSGPNSFGKGKNGFTHHAFRKFELSMKPRNSMEKQTTYDPKKDK